MGRLAILIPGIILCVFVVAATLAIHVSHATTRERLHAQVTQQMQERITFLQGAAQEYLELGLQDRLQHLISSFAADQDLVSIRVIDHRGRVLASNNLAELGRPWQALQVRFDVEALRRAQRGHYEVVHGDPDTGLLDAYTSLCITPETGSLRRKKCGFINYRTDLQSHLTATNQALAQQSAYYLGGMAAVVLVTLVLLHLLIGRRTERVAAVLRSFGDDRRAVRVPPDWNDEIGELGRSINTLLDQVVADEVAVREGHARLHSLFDTIGDSVIVISDKGIIESANPATQQIFGYPPQELIGNNIKLLMPEPLASSHDRHLENHRHTGEKRMIGIGRRVEARHRSGHTFPVELAVSEMQVHGRRLFTGIVRDISEQAAMHEKVKQAYRELQIAHERLEEKARIDDLTGLHNRGHFDITLESEIRRATRCTTPLSLLLLDVDYFKLFNDHYGHLEGDRCLQEISKVLREVFKRSGEVTARYGGEEFAVILSHNNGPDAAAGAERLLRAVRDRAMPHAKSRIADHVTVSVGVVTYYPNTTSPPPASDLLKAADVVLYHAKAAGRNQMQQGIFNQNRGNAA